MEESEPLFTIPFMDEEVAVRSFDEFREIAKTEYEFWKWLNQPQLRNTGQYQNLHKLHAIFLQALNSVAGQNEQQFEDSGKQTVENEIQNLRTQKIGWPLRSTTQRALLVDSLREKDDLTALAALAYFCKTSIVPNFSFSCQRGIAAAIDFEAGRSSDNADRAALDMLYKELSGKVELLKTRVEDLSNARNEAIQSNKDLAAQEKERFDALFAETEEECKRHADAYLAQMQIKAPVKYWEDNGNAYANKAVDSWKWCLWTTVGVFTAFLALASVTIFSNAADSSAPSIWQLLGNNSAPSIWQRLGSESVVILVLFVAISLLVLKVLVRMHMSNKHLEAVAHERVTMAKTYLALVAEDKGTADRVEDRQLVLQALFSPVMTGFIAGEETPTSPFEMIQRMLRGG